MGWRMSVESLVRDRIAFLDDEISQTREMIASASSDLADMEAEHAELVGYLSPKPRKRPLGHWISAGIAYPARIPEIGAASGWQRRLYWRDIEPEPGVYHAWRIGDDLGVAASGGVGYLLQLLSFRSYRKDVKPCPKDLEYLCIETDNGWLVPWWNSFVMDRIISVHRVIGALFDRHPIFCGLASEETATGLGGTAPGYTVDAAMDQLERLVRETTKALPTSNFDLYLNFLPGAQNRMGELASRLSDVSGWTWAGPDILPADHESGKALHQHLYPQMREYSGSKALCMQHKSIELNRHAEMVALAKGVGVERIVWNESTAGKSIPSALAFIAQDNWRP